MTRPAPDTTPRTEAADMLTFYLHGALIAYPDDRTEAILVGAKEHMVAIEAEARQQVVEQIRETMPDWFPCRCDEAYSKRDLVDPDCPTHDMERWLDEVAASRLPVREEEQPR